MGIARSTYYDRPKHMADDTAIVEAMFEVCDETVVSAPLCGSWALSSITRRSGA